MLEKLTPKAVFSKYCRKMSLFTGDFKAFVANSVKKDELKYHK